MSEQFYRFFLPKMFSLKLLMVNQSLTRAGQNCTWSDKSSNHIVVVHDPLCKGKMQLGKFSSTKNHQLLHVHVYNMFHLGLNLFKTTLMSRALYVQSTFLLHSIYNTLQLFTTQHRFVQWGKMWH